MQYINRALNFACILTLQVLDYSSRNFAKCSKSQKNLNFKSLPGLIMLEMCQLNLSRGIIYVVYSTRSN